MTAAGGDGGRGVGGGRQGRAQTRAGGVRRGRDAPRQRRPRLRLDGHGGWRQRVPVAARTRVLLQLGRGLCLCLRVGHYRLPLR